MSDARRQELEAELKRLGAAESSSRGQGTSEESITPASPAGTWETYYDNAELALTLRGWWLRETCGGWLLRVPEIPFVAMESAVLALPAAAAYSYEEITEPALILEKVGLVQHAEAFRKGVVASFETLLAQAKVLPFARLHTTRRAFCLPFPSTTSDGAELTVIVDSTRFDVKYAENEAVAESIFDHGNAAGRRLRISQVELRLAGGAKVGRAALTSFLQERGLCSLDRDVGMCPRLLTFLRAWRPAHLRGLLRVRAIPDVLLPQVWDEPPAQYQ